MNHTPREIPESAPDSTRSTFKDVTSDSVRSTFKGLSGAYLTKQLFYETADTSRESVLYTLKDDDWKGYPSLRRLYLDMGDDTEFFFAEKYFAGWPHWTRLLNCTWFIDFLTPVREELKTRQAAENLLRLRQKAREGDVKTAQYLLERKWEKDSVGRPSKEKIKQEAEKMAQDTSDIFDDFARIAESLK